MDESGQLDLYTKKEASLIRKEMSKLQKTLVELKEV